MQKKKSQPCKAKNKSESHDKTREEEAAEIMAILTKNAVFSKDEPVEIIFSDRSVILSPDKDKTPENCTK